MRADAVVSSPVMLFLDFLVRAGGLVGIPVAAGLLAATRVALSLLTLTVPVALILLSALGGILAGLILTRLILILVGTLIDVGH